MNTRINVMALLVVGLLSSTGLNAAKRSSAASAADEPAAKRQKTDDQKIYYTALPSASHRNMSDKKVRVLKAPNEATRKILILLKCKNPLPQDQVNVIVQLLSDGGDLTGVDVKSEEELTALHYLVINGHQKVLRAALAAGKAVKLNVCDSHGLTPLHHAIKIGNNEAAKLLLEYRADVDKCGVVQNVRATSLADTPLYLAVQYGNLEAARMLLDYGADMYLRYNQEPFLPFHLAVQLGSQDLVRFFIERGIDVNVLSKVSARAQGETALTLAVKHCPAVIDMLLEAGANPRQDMGFYSYPSSSAVYPSLTAFELAQQKGLGDIVAKFHQALQ